MVCGGAGDAGAPARREPWVNLAGWWGARGFYAGGEIPGGDQVARVRLITRNGVTLDDDDNADGGWALFLTDRTITVPVVLELCDPHDGTLATQIELDAPT